MNQRSQFSDAPSTPALTSSARGGDGTDIPRLLTPAEVARLLKVSVSWLAKSRMRGDGPPFVKIGRSVRYSSAVKEWLRTRGRTSTSESEATNSRSPQDIRKGNSRP